MHTLKHLMWWEILWSFEILKATKQSSSHQNDTNRRTRRNHNGQKCTEERTTGPEWGAGVGIESRACEREILGTRTTPPKQLAEHSYPNLVPALLRNCAHLLWPVHHPTMNTTRILTLISDLLGSDDFFESSSWLSVTLLFPIIILQQIWMNHTCGPIC